MKSLKLLIISLIVLWSAGCTNKFEDMNTDPNAVSVSEASAKYFITTAQFKLYAPDNYYYWRAQLIHADRFAGYFTFGDNYSWWDDELGYKLSVSYTDATYEFFDTYFTYINNFLKITKPGGQYENQYMYAVGLVMKSLYYQMYTETFGEIPYTQAGNPDITLPAYDNQKTIYKGIIADLDAAMTTIGDATKTGVGMQDLGDNDLYCKGDLQKWKKLANTLKLRIALRAYGATGDDFAAAAIAQACSSDLLSTKADNVIMQKDNVISKWTSDSYAGAWLDYGGDDSGGGWTVSKTMIDLLRKYNDPRTSTYVVPAKGGTFIFKRPASGNDHNNWPQRLNYICQILTDAGALYTRSDNVDTTTISMPAGVNYVGQPVRLNSYMQPLVRREFFCTPSDYIVVAKNATTDLYPELVLTTAEAYFLKAEAIVRGIPGVTGDAQALFQEGIRQSMLLWKCSDADISAYLSSASIADISSGTTAEKIEKIATQRWINSYTEGFEGWAIVRKLGYPSELANGVSDAMYFGLGDIDGKYPERMQYGTSAYSTNVANLNAAIADQGPDKMDTKLWFSK